MKVLHLAAGNLFGGVETLLVTFARLRHLCPEMEPAFSLCFPGRLRDELSAAGVPIHDLGSVRTSRPWTVLRARRRLRQTLREQHYDAVVTHGMWPHAVFAPVVRKARVRLVNAVHDYLTRGHWINRWAARTAPDAVVTNSQFTAPSAVSMFPGVPIVSIPLPVACPTVDRAEARREVRKELGTPDDAVVILQASRLEEWKGQSIHVEALRLLKDVAGWEAWFAGGAQKKGEAEFLARLKTTIAQSGIANQVKFLGQRGDVQRLMAAADVYCQPNTGPEPFGIVFVEAMHSGLPVVTSKFGGAVEIVTPAQGTLCPPADVTAVATALRELITDPVRRRQLGDAGPSHAVEICDPTRQLRRFAELLSFGTIR